MTIQRTERIHIGSKEYFMWTYPLEQFWNEKNPRPNIKYTNPDCLRGYIGTWQIFSNEIRLLNIEGKLNLIQGLELNSRILKGNIYLVADWFTGILEIPLGDETDIYCDIQSKYARCLILEANNGIIVKKSIVENIDDLEIEKAIEKYYKKVQPRNFSKPHSNEIKMIDIKISAKEKENKTKLKAIIDKQIDGLQIPNLYKHVNSYIEFLIHFYDLEISPNSVIYRHYNKIRDYINEKIEDKIPLTKNESSIFRMNCYKITDLINWGKYKGRFVGEIIESDPEYLLWCILSIDHFAIENVCFLTEGFRIHKWFKIALETNLIKLDLIIHWRNKEDESSILKNSSN